MARPEPLFLNRELSWLEFNQRVLEEARDTRVPLGERLLFLGISGSNLDEFCMVRVGGLHLQVKVGLTRPDAAGLTPGEQLRRVRVRLRAQMADQYACLDGLLTKLATHGVRLAPGRQLSAEDRLALEPHFESEIFPVLTPIAVVDDAALPLLTPLALYLACRLAPDTRPAQEATAAEAPPAWALIRLGPGIARVVRAPVAGATERHYVMIEDLVRAFLHRLFPGREIVEAVTFRITRNADIEVDEEYAVDLASAMARVVSDRRTSPCVRLEIEAGASPEMVTLLRQRLAIDDADLYPVDGPLDLTGLSELRSAIEDPALRYPAWTPQPTPELDPTVNIFEQVAQRDHLVAVPYESFDPVLRLVQSAATDPDVRAIKIVLYRTSARGPIVRALLAAAQAGKHVTALIELKARFDEARNIDWAHGLEQAGVQVIYGVRRLKTHAKICLVVRRERDGVRYYVHYGTGNYNEVTARLYTDVGLLTCDPSLGRDAAALFHAITGYSEPQPYLRLTQAPIGLRARLLDLIRFETELAERQQPARILAKMNALVDTELIAALYEASQAGVEIRLAIRGICCLRPGVKRVSQNIVVTGVIDRFLEHSRIFAFLHGGDEEVFISSADWMPRNLDRRIELLVPVSDPDCRRKLRELLDTSLSDNTKAWRLLPDGTYRRIERPHGQRAIRSQEELCERASQADRLARRAARTQFEPHLPQPRR